MSGSNGYARQFSGRSEQADVIILGAGPGGLTAAYDLSKHGVTSIVLERDSEVGGLAKTVDYKGYLFDLGGHRFYTKVPVIEKIWHEVLGPDFLKRPRLSRIYYRSKFFHYPVEIVNVIQGLGPAEILLCGLSFAKSRLFPERPEKHFAAWVSNRFGRRLFRMFFESYTEKVWGMRCTELSADWAAQRIRGLSFSSAVKNGIRKRRAGKSNEIKTLIREFHYPRRGPGMMWTRMKELAEQRGARVISNAPVHRVFWNNNGIEAVEANGILYTGKHFISTLAIRDLFEMLSPAVPEFAHSPARQLAYRDFITVGIIVRGRNLFPDNWIYVHDPSVAVGRIQNYTNWSGEMSPNPEYTNLGLEYFCTEGDALWKKSDAELLELARRDVAALGLVEPADVIDGVVIRVPKAYPVYDHDYKTHLARIREFLRCVPNLQLAGRNGMHRYNNQDHSMLTALMASRNILGANFDLWQFHEDSEYLEEGLVLSDSELAQLELCIAREVPAQA